MLGICIVILLFCGVFFYEKICLQAFMILICTDQPAHLLSGQGMHSLGFEFCMFH